jgi:phosphate starvation-inducible PhoH-like protein
MVITGDISQSDLPTGCGSGLADAMKRLNNISGIAMHRFEESDVVRHPLVRKILRAYEERN